MKQKTVQEAAINYINTNQHPFPDEVKSFIRGANWQKEQDKAIIEKLLEAINEDFFMRERNKALIEKALNHIKTN